MEANPQARERALEVARGIIGGRTMLVRGVRELSSLRGEICRDPLSPTLLSILAAADDTRELRLDWSLDTRSADEIDALNRHIEDAENLHRESVLSACRELVRKLERR